MEVISISRVELAKLVKSWNIHKKRQLSVSNAPDFTFLRGIQMATYLIAIIVIFIGGFMPFQAAINARLGQRLESPITAALISFAIGFLVLALAHLFLTKGLPEFKKLLSVPWHLYLGGVFGALFVLSALFFIPKIGPLALVASFITGQIVTSTFMDHFGFLIHRRFPLTPLKVIGLLLLIAGLVCILWKQSAQRDS